MPSHRPAPAPVRRRGARALRISVVALVVAAGLSVVPMPTVSFVADYAAHRELLHFPSAGAQELPADALADAPVESEVAEVEPFVTIGVSLPEAPSAPVSIRWRDADGWSDWQELEIEADKGPDASSAEAAAARPGVMSQPLWVGEATAYQVSLPADSVPAADATTDTTTTTEPAAGAAPEVVVVRPDGGRLEVQTDSVKAGAATYGQPAIHTRGEWGARGPSNPVGTASELKIAVVHHSATGNDYSPAEVPGIIRSIQAFHMDGNGWSDIGYNFVVDKYGGMWEGRDGSLLRHSIGAHAEGFNTGSVGVMALGNFSAGAPSATQVTNIADIIAWKFANAGIDPGTSVSFTSGGSSTIPAGQVVNLPRVVGHRDVGSTDCPGANLYSQLSSRIRPILPTLVAAKASPIGAVDLVAPGPGSVVVSGWALDPLEAGPIEVHVYIDGVGTNLGPTPFERPDLAGPFPGMGTKHGFAATIGGVAPGRHSVCIFGINTGPGSNTLLNCRDVNVMSGDAMGVLEQVNTGPDGVLSLSGWALDPDTSAGAEVHVYLDGRGINLGPASGSRPDVGMVFPGYGPQRGFSFYTGGLAAGRHSVCVFAINAGPGGNNLLGCRDVTVPGGPPTGVLDLAIGGPDGTLLVSGWTIDPDTAAATDVHVYVDATGHNIGRGNGDRPDIARAFPGYGAAHGFRWGFGGLTPGSHRVCAFGIDTAGGSNTLLRCTDAVVPGGSPFGSIDAVTSGGGRVGVTGWTIDPDTSGAVAAHVYIDGVGYNTGLASVSRPDVGAAKPGYGANHGISWVSPVLPPGNHSVCTFGINVGAGGNSLLDCRNVTT